MTNQSEQAKELEEIQEIFGKIIKEHYGVRGAYSYPAICDLMQKAFELSQSQPAIKQWVSEWIDVKDRLPELNQRILISEYEECLVTIANYKIDKVWGDKKGNPCFVDEQDEQPGRCYPTHWKEIDTPKPTAKLIKYEFDVTDGKLTCVSHTNNVSFNEVYEALLMVKAHIERHIDKQQECPFHPSKHSTTTPKSDMVSKAAVIKLIQDLHNKYKQDQTPLSERAIQECITKIKEI